VVVDQAVVLVSLVLVLEQEVIEHLILLVVQKNQEDPTMHQEQLKIHLKYLQVLIQL
jgi:hypothetical protein